VETICKECLNKHCFTNTLVYETWEAYEQGGAINFNPGTSRNVPNLDSKKKLLIPQLVLGSEYMVGFCGNGVKPFPELGPEAVPWLAVHSFATHCLVSLLPTRVEPASEGSVWIDRLGLPPPTARIMSCSDPPCRSIVSYLYLVHGTVNHLSACWYLLISILKLVRPFCLCYYPI
jgi:hypothetical protein